jgi:hypothetical protein
MHDLEVRWPNGHRMTLSVKSWQAAWKLAGVLLETLTTAPESATLDENGRQVSVILSGKLV